MAAPPLTKQDARWQATREPRVVVDPADGEEIPLPFDGLDDAVGLGAPAAAPRTVPSPEPNGPTTPESTVICGDVLDVLRDLPAGRISCCATSPPYYGLRSYGIPPRSWPDGSCCVLGDEPTLDEYLQHLVEVFREVKRVLHPRGSLWLNLGDAYAGGGRHTEPRKYADADAHKPSRPRQRRRSPKDLLMVPARAALALQADGWIVRQDNIWAKALSFLPAFSGSVMPESTRDRTTWAYEHVFHLTLRDDSFYDQDAMREPYAQVSMGQEGYTGHGRKDYAGAKAQNPSDVKRRVAAAMATGTGRNLRNVWVIPKQNARWREGTNHFAVWPEKLAEVIIRLASNARGVCAACGAPTTCTCDAPSIPATILDPFSGSGRTGMVAKRLGRSFIGIDANPAYCAMAREAIEQA